MQMVSAIGIDVGGTGIKGAAVNPETGELLTQRHRVGTPAGAAPGEVCAVVSAMVAQIRSELHEKGFVACSVLPALGVALPGVVQHGVMRTAANVDRAWLGVNVRELLSEATGLHCEVVNDADAAGVAEVSFGAAKGVPGVTIMLTFGTGIGSALIHEGVLVPNVELGHLSLEGQSDYERYASVRNIQREGISVVSWASRVAPYLRVVEQLLTPNLFIVGGSISKSSDLFLPFEGVRTKVVAAQLRNSAGIVGAALLAWRVRAGSK